MDRKKPVDDGKTRVMPAYTEPDEDRQERRPSGMIAASPSLWTKNEPPPRTSSQRPPAPRPSKPSTPNPSASKGPPKKQRGVGTWAAVGALVFAGGGGLAFGLAALGAPDGAPTNPRATAPVAVTSAPAPIEPSAPKPVPEPIVRPAAEAPRPIDKPIVDAPKPPTWVADVERTNPWRAIVPADRERLLGVSVEALGATYADRITGLWPDRRIMAPRDAYAMQEHEVSWAELEAAAASVGGVSTLTLPAWVPTVAAKRASLPATGVPWPIARAFCRTMGGDLPTEAQWEWAARGPDDHYFPWGREAVDSNKVRIFARKPIPLAAVGKSSQDVSDRGVRDLLGNAQEWTRDVWVPGRGTGAGPEAHKLRVVRGWPLTARGEDVPSEGSTYREAECAEKTCAPSEAAERIGFRCIKEGNP